MSSSLVSQHVDIANEKQSVAQSKSKGHRKIDSYCCPVLLQGCPYLYHNLEAQFF